MKSDEITQTKQRGQNDQGEKPDEQQYKGPVDEDKLRKVRRQRRRVSLKKSRETFLVIDQSLH